MLRCALGPQEPGCPLTNLATWDPRTTWAEKGQRGRAPPPCRPRWLLHHSWEAPNEALGFPSGLPSLGEQRKTRGSPPQDTEPCLTHTAERQVMLHGGTHSTDLPPNTVVLKQQQKLGPRAKQTPPNLPDSRSEWLALLRAQCVLRPISRALNGVSLSVIS